MADCPCTIIPTSTSIAVTSGNVTFDGGATCTGFNAGDVNDFIEHISDLVCALQANLAALTVSPTDITTTGLIDPSCFTSPTYGDNLAAYINEIATILCNLESDLSTLVIADIGGTFDLSCINAGYAASTLQQAIDRLTVAVCAINSGQLTMDLLMRGGAMELPLMEFAKDTVTITDISALGVAKVNIDATDYWINATALSMIGTNITPLVDSQDNYIFIDKDTQAYDWTAVAIGAAAPVTNGDKVAMVRTGVGTVTSITRLIGYSPIDSDILEDDSIDATKLTTTICTTPLENNGTNLILNYDNDDFDVSAGNLILKAGCIANTSYFDMAGVCEPSIELSSVNKLQVATEDSVELDAVTARVQFVNDQLAPGNLMYYGTDDSGTKGYHEIPGLKRAEVTLTDAQVEDLNANPVTLVASAGADTAIIVDKVIVIKPSGYSAYTSANAIEIRYSDGGGNKCADDFPNTEFAVGGDAYIMMGITCRPVTNDRIVAFVPVASPSAGNGGLKIVTYYTVEDVSY